MKLIFLSVILLSTGASQIFSGQMKVTTTVVAPKTEITTTVTRPQPMPASSTRPATTTKTTTTLAAPIISVETKTTAVMPPQTQEITTTTVAVPSTEPTTTQIVPVQPVQPVQTNIVTTAAPRTQTTATIQQPSTPPGVVPTPAAPTVIAPVVSAPRATAPVSPAPKTAPVVEKRITTTVTPPSKPVTKTPAEAKPIPPKVVEKKEVVKKPEVVQPKKEEMLDTIDIEEGGNWLIKRQIFEDTFKLMDQMDQVNIKIRDMRITFYKARNDIDKQVALFIKDIGYSLGKLDQMATMILSRMEQERALEGSLSDEERSIVTSLEHVEEEVKQIQDAIQEIMNLDNKIDAEILKSLEDRINESAGYRQQGWKNLQSIKQMLNDEKAQNLYNKTKALYETMQNVLSWLQTKLLPYFNQTVQTIKNDMNTVKSKLAELQSKGVDLQQEIAKIENQAEVANQERVKEKIQDAVNEATGQIKDNQKQGFLDKSGQIIQNTFSWLTSFFTGQQPQQEKEDSTKREEAKSISVKRTGTSILK